MRLFVAAPLPETVRSELRLQQDRLKSRREAVNWVRNEHLHLTLRFIGETEKNLVEPIAGQLEALALRTAPLSLALGEPGFFGGAHAPRVLWTGLCGETGELITLARRLERALLTLGLPRADLRFKPHLTLGRIKACRPDLPAAHLSAPPLPVGFILGELRLVESTLKPEGPVHHVLTRHTLTDERTSIIRQEDP